MLKMIADIRSQIMALEAHVTSLEVAATMPAAVEKPKEKRPLSQGMKNWHDRCQRLDACLKHHELSFKRVAEAKQFASMIYAKEKVAGIDMKEQEIIAARRLWAEEHKALCVVCKADATEDPSKHGECAAKFIKDFMEAGSGDKEAGMAAWLKASGLKMPKSDSEDEASVTKKPAGRPKMTEEQKAAAKAAKAAMTPEQKAAAKAAREAKKAAAPVKKVAWGENAAAGGGGGQTFEEELDEAITSM